MINNSVNLEKFSLFSTYSHVIRNSLFRLLFAEFFENLPIVRQENSQRMKYDFLWIPQFVSSFTNSAGLEQFVTGFHLLKNINEK